MKTKLQHLLILSFVPIAIGVFNPSSVINSQNLVPNWSFEDTVACPTGLSQIYKAEGWIINVNTSDYYNGCNPNQYSVSVPNNPEGFQIPSTGDAYCGFCNYVKTPIGDVREYLGRRLSSPLITGQKYYASIKVSWADGWCATNKMGILFSNKYYGDSTTWGVLISPPPFINNFAHVYTNEIIVDSVNWTVIQGSFIADSAYEYIYIGNFFSRANTDTLWYQGGLPDCKSYYFIDDVCVSTDSLTCIVSDGIYSDFSKTNFSIFPNPVNDILYLKNISSKDIISLNIYDILGKYQKISFLKSKDEIEIDLRPLKTGTYFLIIKLDNEVFRRKLIKL